MNQATNELVVELVRAKNEMDAAEEVFEAKKREYNELNRVVTEHYEFNKIQQLVVDVDGEKKSAHLRGQYWAKKHEGADSEAIYDALIEIGVPELALKTYNAQTLSSWLREKFKDNPDYEIPEQLASLVDFKKVTQIVVTGK